MKVSPLELWQMIRSKIQNEESWIQQSVSWHLASTAFLFSAFSVLVASTRNLPAPLPFLVSVLLVMIPVVGASFSIFVYIGIIVSSREVGHALHEWQSLVPNASARNKLPAIQMTPASVRLGRLATTGISVIAISMWLILLALSIAMLAGIIA